MLPILAASCRQDDVYVAPLTPMYQMYDESTRLTQATVDSISSFCVKFNGYIIQHPVSRQDQYFDPTLQNLRDAAALYGYTIKETTVTAGITINDEWDGETVIYF